MGKALGAISAIQGIAGLLNQNQNQVQAQIDPTLLNFLQNQGNLAARFQGSQEGLPYGGSTATTARSAFNQYGALLDANQTANQVASAQQGINQALNAGNQLQIGSSGQQGGAAGLTAGSQGNTSIGGDTSNAVA